MRQLHQARTTPLHGGAGEFVRSVSQAEVLDRDQSSLPSQLFQEATCGRAKITRLARRPLPPPGSMPRKMLGVNGMDGPRICFVFSAVVGKLITRKDGEKWDWRAFALGRRYSQEGPMSALRQLYTEPTELHKTRDGRYRGALKKHKSCIWNSAKGRADSA